MPQIDTHSGPVILQDRPDIQPHAHAARGCSPRRARGAAVLLPEGGVGADRRAAAPRPGMTPTAPGEAVRIVTIDTGVLFPETLETWRAFEQRFGVEIEVQDASNPENPWSGPEHCCSVAKVAALESSLAGAEGWITGIRREQGPTRAATELIERDAQARPVEVQPAGALDGQGPVAADPRARPALQPAARPGLRVDRLRAVHAAGLRPRGPLGRHRQDRVRTPRRGRRAR